MPQSTGWLAGRVRPESDFFGEPPATTLSTMYWQLFLWPLKLPGVALVFGYAVIGYGFLFLIDYYFGIEPLSRALTVGFSLPWWYFITASLALYGQKMLVHSSRGLFGEVMEQQTNVNPFRNLVALKLWFLLVLALAVVVAIGETPTLARALIPVLIFPLLWLSITLEESLLAGLRFRHVTRLVGGLGFAFPLVAVLLSCTVGYMAHVIMWEHSFLGMLGSAYGFLVANAITGAILYWRRHELNLRTEKSPEQERTLELAAEAVELDQLFHELHRHCANGNLGTAFELLKAFMGERTEELDGFMHQRLLQFQDKRLTLLHAVDYLQRLADGGNSRKAWVLLKSCLELDERFRPLDDSTLLALTRGAGREDAGIVNVLLADFQTCYPDSEHIGAAMFRRARVCIELLGDRKTGIALIDDIASAYPEFAATQQYQRYKTRLTPR